MKREHQFWAASKQGIDQLIPHMHEQYKKWISLTEHMWVNLSERYSKSYSGEAKSPCGGTKSYSGADKK